MSSSALWTGVKGYYFCIVKIQIQYRLERRTKSKVRVQYQWKNRQTRGCNTRYHNHRTLSKVASFSSSSFLRFKSPKEKPDPNPMSFMTDRNPVVAVESPVDILRTQQTGWTYSDYPLPSENKINIGWSTDFKRIKSLSHCAEGFYVCIHFKTKANDSRCRIEDKVEGTLLRVHFRKFATVSFYQQRGKSALWKKSCFLHLYLYSPFL